MRHIFAVAVGLIAVSAFPALTHAYEIRNDTTGGDCTQVGTWDVSTKTCVLTADASSDEFYIVQDAAHILDNNGITLDGNGHTVNSVYVNASDTTVKHIRTLSTRNTIFLQYAYNTTLDDIVTTEAIYVRNSGNVTFRRVTSGGMNFGESGGIHISDSHSIAGAVEFGGSIANVTIDGLTISNGMFDYAPYSTENLTMRNVALIDGSLFDLHPYFPSAFETFDIDTSNTINGLPILFLVHESDKDIDASGNSTVYCISCVRVHIHNLINPNGYSGIYTFGLMDSEISQSSSTVTANFWLASSTNLKIHDNTINGLIFFEGNKSGIAVYHNNFNDAAIVNGEQISYSLPLPIGGNWWSGFDTPSEGCHDANTDNICDSPLPWAGYADQYPWTRPDGWNATTTPPISSKTPVLFIPGIMGTEMSKNGELLWADIDRMIKSVGIPFVSRGDQFLDPLAFKSDGTATDTAVTVGNVISTAIVPGPLTDFDYTTGLTSELLSRGYSTSTNSTSSVFALFPYDWRKDIADVANNELKAKIDTLLSQTGSQKIDIIAHSQGGLLIKKLLLDYPAYKSKIRKLIFLGTPQLGAPKAAKSLLYGDPSGISIGYKMLNINFLDSDEVKYIGHNMPSAYELLPSPTYFTATSSYLGVDALVNAPPAMVVGYNNTTNKLKALGLNAALLDRATAFHQSGIDTMNFSNSGIDVTNIVSCGRPSPGQIIKSSWGRSRITYVPGDGTVPVLSASALQGASTTYYIWDKRVEHAGMPSAAGVRQSLADILEGKSVYEDPAVPSTFYTVSYGCNLSGHEFDVHSPVDLNIYDSHGNHLGPTDDGGFEANIPGSSYDTLGDEKFAFVPEGTYTIKLNATDSGHFSFFSSKIENNETVSTASYLDIPITSTSKAQVITNDTNTQTIALDTTGQGTATTTVTPTAVLTGSSTDDLTPPITTLIATGTKVGSYYTSNVTITFSATDTATSTETASGVLKTEYAYDNSTSTIWRTATTSILATTTTTVYYYSTDRLGNKEAIASTTIVINKNTPPTHHLTTGTTTPFTDPTGTLWQGDQYFQGGTMASRGAIAIANTLNDRLYQSERYGMTGYAIPVPNGTYQVTLHFAETSPTITAAGQRTFTVALEGTTILTNLDIFKEAGKNTALIKTFTTSVTDGTLNLTFTKVVNAPEINGIEVMPADTTPPSTPTNLTAVAASSSQINLTWATSTDAVGYQLERCTGATCTTFTQIATTTVPTYKNTALTASTTYRYRVRAYDLAGNRSTYSTTTTITTPKAPQTIFQDTFESALTWAKTGAVTWYTGTPKVGTHAVKLTTTASIEKAISLQNYQNITVSFRMGANSLDTSSENVQALYYNGSAWVTLTTIANNTANENNQLNPYTFTLPTTMNNKATFKLRFKINGSATDDAAFVDEVKVVGVGM